MNEEINRYMKRHDRRHIFRCFRKERRWFIAPLYVSFSIVDYIYSPEHAPMWLIGRLAFFGAVLIGFQLLKNPKIRRNHSFTIAATTVILANNLINWMIYQTGGATSLYLTGLILVTTTGIELLRLSRRQGLYVNIASYLPTLVILGLSTTANNWAPTLIQASFLGWMTLLSWVFRGRLDVVATTWARARNNLEQMMRKLQRTEFLKEHFPPQLRERIENGLENIPAKQVLSMAAIGFADIGASTEICNSLHLSKDWELKEKFFEAASNRATQCNMVVLHHIGDGILFMANYSQEQDWALNLVSFVELLLNDFDKMKLELGLQNSHIQTGIKCSVALGPAMLGFIGKNQKYFTAMGPDVNLASRLCDRAMPNELVVSGRVWYVLKNHMLGWDVSEEVFNDLKGFDTAVPAIRIRPRTLANETKNTCLVCGSTLSIIMTDEGFFDVSCPNGHTNPTSNSTEDNSTLAA